VSEASEFSLWYPSYWVIVQYYGGAENETFWHNVTDMTEYPNFGTLIEVGQNATNPSCPPLRRRPRARRATRACAMPRCTAPFLSYLIWPQFKTNDPRRGCYILFMPDYLPRSCAVAAPLSQPAVSANGVCMPTLGMGETNDNSGETRRISIIYTMA
jgi:hypothetical protein